MRSTSPYGILKTIILAVTVLLLTASASYAQVGLTAMPTTTTLPDGRSVQMWGLFCASGSNTNPATGPTCTALNGAAQSGLTWQPPLIRIQTGSSLTINLTNNLPLPPGATTGIPTSLMIVGQLGGGLGTPTKVDSPAHAAQGATWPIAGDTSGPVFTPPVQGQRVQSFGTEVARGATTSLTWTGLKAGTYLIESGTHPSIQGPMGLYGVLIVTDISVSPAAAYPGVTYDKDLPLLLSEIDAEQNAAMAAAVATSGFSETAIRVLRDSVSSVSLELDAAGNPINAGTGYHVGDAIVFAGGGFSVPATAHVAAVDVNGAIINVTGIAVDNPGQGYSSVPTAVVSGSTGGSGAQVVAALSLAGVTCSDGAAACYPPTVNYDPRYYLINGIAFDKTNPGASTWAGPGVGAAAATGNVLLRFVNAGLRMHLPSVVGRNMSLIAEDGNVLPGIPKIQNEVFLPPGKVYDVMIHPASAGGLYTTAALPVFDRQLSLSTNNQRDGGMQAYISVNGGSAPLSGLAAVANPDSYFLLPGKTVTVSDPAKGVIANDINVYGVSVLTPPVGGTLSLQLDGTFTYVPNTGTTSDSFVYQANGNPLLQAVVTLGACTGPCLGGAPTAMDDAFTSRIASRIQVSGPGVLANDKDPQGHPLTVDPLSVVADPGLNVAVNPDGSFIATVSGAGSITCPTGTPALANCFTFQYQAVNSQGALSTAVSTTNTPHGGKTVVTLAFLRASGVTLVVKDAKTGVELHDYRWIVEEDRTFKINPATQVNTGGIAPVPSLGTNFHTSYMPVIAEGCVGVVACEAGQTVLDPSTGAHNPAVCDIGNGVCRTTGTQQAPVTFDQVSLDPTKHYYVSILPGDGGNSFTAGAGAPMPVDPNNPTGPQRPFNIALDCPSGPAGPDFAPGTGTCGHTMGGSPISPGQAAVTVQLQQTPLPTATISVFVFEDDFPLNGEHDAGGSPNGMSTNEVGLGGFALTLFDQAGGFGDSTGQPTYDMLNMPLSNSLAGTIDPSTGLDACPISPKSKDGLVGMIVTCPKFESDGKTLSPLAGNAVIANLYPGLYEVVATPGADRIARGEEWLQTNTLDGTKAHEAFIRQGEPSYFQEFGPAGFHVSIGFANPAIINARKPAVCANQPCTSSVTGRVTTARISRTPDQRIFSSGSYDALGFTQCYVSLGDPDGEDIAFTKCNPDGTFTLTGLPPGTWRVTVFDQWNDILVDGLATPVALTAGQAINMGDVAMQQWRTNLSTRTFIDLNGDGVSQDIEPGLPLVPVNIRYRDGSFMGFNNTDLNGNAGFNEIFPFFNWLVLEADTTRYKQTGVHVVYDAGGAADCTTPPGVTPSPLCSTIAANVANTRESATAHLPSNLRVPGAVYCDNADCTGFSIKNGPGSSAASPSTGRIDPPWVTTEGWQGFIGHTEFFEFGKAPFAPGENGGIKGHVAYASTRPFDDPSLLLQLSWGPLVPGVTVNLYREGTATDGTQSLTLVDTTKTSSWDDWAQGFRSDGLPNMNCPGQETTSPFYFTLRGSTQWLNPSTPLPNESRFKCYDGMALLNQAQPAPYDGMYQFPSVTARNPQTALPTGTNCTICVPNPTGDGTRMLPAGKYVVEVVVPPGYELVKEEDKNILIGDNYIAPVTQQFAGLGSIFILPDQAEVNGQVNPNNPQNPTNNLGSTPRHEGDTGSIEAFWPCVGQLRVVPDYISLFPRSAEVAPFAGASRHLCDRKEVTLEDQMSVLAKFYLFSSTHVAGHFTGIITNDFASEFDPFSPQFGEKFAVPNLPVSFKDFNGVEIARTYSDQWGYFDGLNYSTWEVNPPNPTGYAPTMMTTCMNDPGPIPGPNGTMIPDPLYNPNYSQFCYQIPFMPGQTQYMDTPVVPTSAFADGYNQPDCAYPDATPAIKQVNGDGVGPWVAAPDGGNAVASVALTNGGSGYTSRPSVSFSGGGGSGAAAAATLRVNSITISNRGSGYTNPPSVSFSGGGGSGAAATVTMRLGSVTVTNAGLRYTSVPTVTFNNTGTGGFGASATATMRVSQIVLSSGGSGYTSAPTVTISLPGGTCTPSGVRATATATISGGSVTGITITNQGSCYNSRPTVSFSGGGGTGAAASNSTTTGTFMSVNAIAVGSFGTGYISQPGVTIGAAPSGGTTATATAFLVVNIITLSAGGSGYTAAPSVSFSAPPSGVTAVGSATMSVNALTVTAGGLGYTSTPSVSFNNSGTGGSGAAATATLGPSAASHTLTITALGDQLVPNHGYAGPRATSAPFNQRFITRHYGFGATQGTGSVTIAGVNAPVVSWSDAQIVITVPSVPAAQSTCTMPQRGVSGAAATNYRCGELVITAGNGKKSIDTVTVTVGGKPPTYVNGENATNSAIQTALDNATPGDLIMVGPGIYNELLLMWKPVRLQGAGAASVTVNANTHPSGKLEPWRRQVNCLFGLALNGSLLSAGNVYDPTGMYSCSPAMQAQVDPLPFEGIIGWDALLNGNLAEFLQEPTLMGAYEGAGITALGKGENLPSDQVGSEGAFPPNARLLTTADCTTSPTDPTNPFPSNFLCNPSRIDGMTFTNSSQGGGGILLHGWNHYMEVSNNRVINNQGTLGGGITIGQGEFPGPIIDGNGVQQPYLQDTNVRVHHNSVTRNASEGDELFSTTPAGAGGVIFCTGSDYYHFNDNWVCGNLSTGNGGGLVHLGFSYNGDISRNSILFNQSFNPSIPTHGGGIAIQGAAPDGLVGGGECGGLTDLDCAPALSEGVGPGLVIDSNLIMGNTAESGSGGGLRIQTVNGDEVIAFPLNPEQWYQVTVTNNIIANNVAGWDGGGVSLQDALKVNLINNTVIANDSTASAGVLFNTLGAPNASVPPPGCDPTTGIGCTNVVTTSTNQAAGLVTMRNTSNLTSFLPAVVNCPSDHPNCRQISNPLLRNNLFWQNRSFFVTVGGLGSGLLNQQNVVTLVPALNQTSTGACQSGATSWDIGVRGDAGPANHASGFTLSPANSILTSLSGGYSGNGNIGPSSPGVVRQYCNGSRVPPENGGFGFNVPPGIADATVPNPRFNLTPAATVDEGNNWINMSYGPLSLSSAAVPSGVAGNGVPLGIYTIAQGSPAISTATSSGAPNHDFFGTPRPAGGGFDIGAVQFVAASTFMLSPTSLIFNSPLNLTSAPQQVQVSNIGTVSLSFTISLSGVNLNQFATTSSGCATLAPGGSCTINVTFTPTTATPTPKIASLNVSGGTGTTTQSVPLTGNVVALPTYTVSPLSLAFGNQLVGTMSAPLSVTITNTGGAGGSPLAMGSPTMGGTNPSQWSTVLTTCPAILPVTPGSNTCTISVAFAPTSMGAQSATLNVNIGAPAAPAPLVQLTGTGIGPVIGVVPASLTFASQTVGTTSAAQTVTVSNTGAVSLTALSVSLGGTNPTDFARPAGAAGGTCGTTLAPTSTCTITLTFTPAVSGARSATLLVSGAAPANTATVSLSGTGGGPVISVSPTSLGFGGQVVTTTSAGQSVIVSNTGNVTLTALSVSFGGTNPTNFARPAGAAGGTCGTTLAAGGNCTITVTFTPSVLGALSATMSVSGAAPANTATVTLSGTGIVGSGIVQVQSNSAQNVPNTTSVTSLAVPFTSANTAGNLIIAFVRMSTTSQTVALTDTRGNPYIQAVAQAQSSDGHQVRIFYARNILGGANAVTATFSAANLHPWLAIYEYSGLSTLDRTASAQGASAAPSSGATLATTSANELVFAGLGLPSSYTGTPTAGSLFTMLRNVAGAGNSQAANESRMVTATGTQTGTFVLSTSANWSVVAATFAGGVNISTTSLPAATQNAAYSTTLAATGGTTPYTWAIVSGTLPTGLALNANAGVIFGTPTVTGTSNFTVSVTDVNSLTTTQALSLTVAAPPTISTTSLPAATQNAAYSATLAATGGITPYTWAIASGTLPTGLTLASGTGIISGTPTGTGTSSFTVRVTDANLATATQALSLTVAATGALTVTTTSLPAGSQNVAYTTTLAASGGTTPYTWTIASGTLPTGLTLASGTGIISGTPTVAGTSNFTVRVTDASLATATQALSLTINGSIAQVQSNSTQATGVTSLSAPFASANTAGNLIIAFVRMSTTSQTVALADSRGNPYVQAVAAVQSSDGSQVRLFYARNILGGANTVTATFSGSNNHPWLAIYEYAGLSTTSPLDQSASAQGASAAPSSGATLATTSANELVFAGLGLPSSYTGTPTAGSLFTLLGNVAGAGNSQAATESRLVTATGAQAGTFVLSTSANWSAVIATFKP
jgi:hypothetical protein